MEGSVFKSRPNFLSYGLMEVMSFVIWKYSEIDDYNEYSRNKSYGFQ
jgi:hypothetical protein